MPGMSYLPKFNYEDLEEIVAVGQSSFGVVFQPKKKKCSSGVEIPDSLLYQGIRKSYNLNEFYSIWNYSNKHSGN